MSDLRFEGTRDYVATPDLMLAVNAAIRLQRPLLIKGEPGTGKTLLAEEVARALAWLRQHAKARMTGSGACVFAPFSVEQDARAVLARMPEGMTGWVARGLDEHPLRALAD